MVDQFALDTAAQDRVFEAYFAAADQFHIALNDEQQAAVISAGMVIEGRSNQFTIHGLAGTGKTVVMAFLAQMYPDSFVVAPTGKAAKQVGDKMGRDADTIHSIFYQLVNEETGKNGKLQPVFRYFPKIARGSIVLLDECSMADVEQRDDILRTGATLIAVGDPGQLKPVAREPGFSVPNFILHEIHRQAAGSPIIQQAHRVRGGLPYEDTGHPDFRVIRDIHYLTDADLLSADMVLCWRNQTAYEMNMRIRKARFQFANKFANKGEPVLCLRNWNEHGIQNGGIYECLDPYNSFSKTITIDVKGRKKKLKHVDWGQAPVKPLKTAFDYGYCLTVNKAQGSEWKKVILIDDFSIYSDRAKWLYTGITRAAESIIVVDAR